MLAKMEECDARVAAGEDTHHPLMILGKGASFGGVSVGTPRCQIILIPFKFISKVVSYGIFPLFQDIPVVGERFFPGRKNSRIRLWSYES